MYVVVYISLLLSILNFVINEKDKDDYGSYILNWLQYEKCKGPKLSDCATYEIANTKNMSDIVFKYDVANDVSITTARITIGVLQGNNKTKKLFNYRLDKPCQHFVLGPILISSFNLTNSCKIKKGEYAIHIDMVEKATMFLGPNFFYGTFNFKMMAMNKVCNFYCINAVLVIDKK